MNDDATTKSLAERFVPEPLELLSAEPQVHGARFSPCGRFLVAGTFDARVRRWRVPEMAAFEERERAELEANGGKPPKKQPEWPEPLTEEVAALGDHNGWVMVTRFAPTGGALYSADTWGRLTRWPYEEDAPQPVWTDESAHDGWVRDIAVSPDGRLVATCGRDRRVVVHDAATGKVLHERTDNPHDVFALAFDPEGRTLFFVDERGRVVRWDPVNDTLDREFDASSFYVESRLQDVPGVHGISLLDEGRTLMVFGGRPASGASVTGTPLVELFDVATGESRHRHELGTPQDVYVFDVAAHEAGFLMAVTSGTPGKGKFLLLEPGAEKPFWETTKLTNCHAVSRHPDGRRLAVTATNRGSNGNGRKVDDDGRYAGNNSPIHVFTLDEDAAT